jgi:hypothetical protein
MEYWSDGVMTKGMMSFFNTPILHHSSIPELQLSVMFDKCSDLFSYVIVSI